jgi:phage shock protein PspC (stress-responsive transcriptional regulator)
VKRLYRSRSNRILTGLCGGIGDYLDVDPVLVRLIWLVIPGLNLLVYIIGSIIVPEEL